MTPNNFVLDENVIIFATKLEAPDGSSNTGSSRLIAIIIESRHKLATDPTVLNKWFQKIYSLRAQNEIMDPIFVHLLTAAGFEEDNFNVYPLSPALPSEHTWPPKLVTDRDFVRLAGQCRGILSTCDQPLIDDIAQFDLESVHDFTVATVEESIGFALEA